MSDFKSLFVTDLVTISHSFCTLSILFVTISVTNYKYQIETRHFLGHYRLR